MIKRLITLILLGFAFYGGLQVERGLSDGRCSVAGGNMVDGVCRGVSTR